MAWDMENSHRFAGVRLYEGLDAEAFDAAPATSTAKRCARYRIVLVVEVLNTHMRSVRPPPITPDCPPAIFAMADR